MPRTMAHDGSSDDDLHGPVSARPVGRARRTLLAQGDETELATRRKRLRDALADFDAATIATTHQFCQSVLRSLGVACDTDSGAELVDSLDDLVVEVVDDRIAAWWAAAGRWERRLGERKY